MSCNRSKQHSGGFTLIEMLVALAIVAIALTAISSSYAALIGNTSSLKERTLARWIAENHAVQQQVENPWPKLGNSDGKLNFAGYNWAWQQSVKATPDADFRRIEISVRQQSSDRVIATLASFARNPNPGKQVVSQ